MPIVRALHLRAFDHDDVTTLLGADGATRTFSGDSAALVRAILAFVGEPRTTSALLAHLGELAGEEVRLEGAVATAIEALTNAGALLEVDEVERAKTTAKAPIRLVLCLSGGIAAMSAPTLVRELQRRGFEIRIAATRSALRFVSALALEALTHRPVARSLWPVDAASPVPHLALATWAEVVAIYPASATTVSRIAQGSCATIVSALAVSARVPVVVFPSMNARMASAPSVLRNLEQLREDGFFVAHASSGYEVADDPGRRPPMNGAAPPIPAAADILQAIVAERCAREVPERARWDDLYASTPIEALPWYADDLDDDVAAILAREAPPPRRFLDVGTGPGTAAIAAAKRGYAVVATDVSAHALEAASLRAGALAIAWVEDDAGDSKLRGGFDVIHDRGCLHSLPRAAHASYAAAIARLAVKGALVIVKTHGLEETRKHATVPYSPSALVDLFGASFEVVDARAATFGGEHGATLVALRRR